MMQDRAIVTMEDEKETLRSFRMVPVGMILSEVKPRIQGHDITQC